MFKKKPSETDWNNFNKLLESYYENFLQCNNKIDEALRKVCPPWAQTDPSSTPKCKKNDFFDKYFNFSEFLIALNSKKTNCLEL